MGDPVLTIALDPSVQGAPRTSFARLLGQCSPEMASGDAFVVDGYSGSIGFDLSTFIEQSSSQYAHQLPLGGHAGGRTFLRNSNRMVSFSLEFRAIGGVDPRFRQVRWPVALLDSLGYPNRDPSTRAAYAPPLIIMSLADVCTVRGFVQSCNTSWGGGWGGTGGTLDNTVAGMSPESATVTLSIIGVGFGGGGYDRGRYAPFESVRRLGGRESVSDAPVF